MFKLSPPNSHICQATNLPGKKSMKKRFKDVQKRIIPHFNGKVFPDGNKKLPKSTLIANLTSARNCPAKALGLCDIDDCYAGKCERIYPYYLARNLIVEEWLIDAPVEDIIELLEAYIGDYEN